jgi:hypothetical protein
MPQSRHVLGKQTHGYGFMIHLTKNKALTEVGNTSNWTVHRELLVVDTKTVAMSVRIREQSGLEDRVCARLDTWDEM